MECVSAPLDKHSELATRYLRGELGDQELQVFEEQLIDDPDQLERLELEWILRKGLAAEESRASGRMQAGWRLAAGVGAVICVGLLGLSIHQSRTISTLEQTAASAIAPRGDVTIARIGPIRSSLSPATRVRLPDDANVVVLAFELSLQTVLESDAFSVRLVDRDSGSLVASLEGLTPRDTGDLLISLPTSELPSGSYTAEVAADSKTVASFEFTVLESE